MDTTEWLHFYFSLSCIEEGNGNPLQCSCLENPRDGGAWWAAIYGVTQSRTRLKWLSSSSSSLSFCTFFLELFFQVFKFFLIFFSVLHITFGILFLSFTYTHILTQVITKYFFIILRDFIYCLWKLKHDLGFTFI